MHTYRIASLVAIIPTMAIPETYNIPNLGSIFFPEPICREDRTTDRPSER